MTPFAKNSVYWVSVLILSLILFSAIRIGLAEIYSISGQATMEQWKRGYIPTAEEISTAQHDFEIAILLANGNPEHHENLARLSIVRAGLPNVSSEDKNAQLMLGLAEIHTAISLRPVSPYGWAILLLIKRDMHQYDEEFRLALHRAVELGPWEPELLTELADVGLSAWNSLQPLEQELIQQVFVRGLNRDDDQMRKVVNSHRNICVDQKIECQ